MTAAPDLGRPWTWPARPAWLALLALGLALRLAYLNLPLRYDEAVTFLGLVDRPLWAALADYSPNNHLLHTALVWLSANLLGEAEWALRLPALLAGVLVVPSLAYVAGRVFGLVEGFAVAGLAAATAWLIVYAVDARGYSLALLALVWAGYFAWRAGEEDRPAWAALTGLLAGLAVAAVLSMLWPLAGLVAALGLAGGPLRVRLRRVLLASAGALVSGPVWYLPALLHSGLQPLLENPHVARVDHLVALKSAAFQAVELAGLAGPTRGLAWVTLGLSLAAGLVVLRRNPSRADKFLIFLPAWSLGVEVLQAVRAPVRTFLYLLPVLHLLWLRAALKLRSRDLTPFLAKLLLIFILGLAALTVIRQAVPRGGEGPSPLAQAVAERLVGPAGLTPEDRVVADVPDDAPLRYYLRRAGFKGNPVLPRGRLEGRRVFVLETPANPLARLQAAWPRLDPARATLVQAWGQVRLLVGAEE